jgi:hypothetical protein
MSAHRSTHRIILVWEATRGGVRKHVLGDVEHVPERRFDVLLVHGTRRAEREFTDRQFANRRVVDRLVALYRGEDVRNGSETRNAA